MSKRTPGSVSLITPSHRGDLERSALLFESIDRHVTGFERHYVIVNDEDLAHFKRFEQGRRVVLPVSDFLPRWLHYIPLLTWRNRKYWWSFRSKPVSGWHTQQLVKIQAASTLPEERFCLIDSDSVFFRPFDVTSIANPNPAPIHVYHGGAGYHRPRHLRWVQSGHKMLGLGEPTFPTDDYIDTIIVWDKSIVAGMIERIEKLSGREWAETLCQVRDFSEYTLYGLFAAHEATMAGRFEVTTDSFCRTYWDAEVLSHADVTAMMDGAAPHEVAICVQSFGPTPVATIRESVQAYDARSVPSARQLMSA